ncbi:MAG: hypothetical protein AAF270_16290 [Pseudomonadota bacterium]
MKTALLCLVAIVASAIVGWVLYSDWQGRPPSLPPAESELSHRDEGLISPSGDSVGNSVAGREIQGTPVQPPESETAHHATHPRELTLAEAPPEAIAQLRSMGYLPASEASYNDYQSYDLDTLKALARSGDGKAASMVVVDWSLDRDERINLALTAARSGSPGALHILTVGEFQNPEFLPDGVATLEQTYVLHLVAMELIGDQTEVTTNSEVDRYASLLPESEREAAYLKANKLLGEIRGE